MPGTPSLRGVLTGEGLSIVLQPIVEFIGGRIAAVEVLSRFAAEPHRSPDRWFAAAAAFELSVAIELVAIRRALEHLDELLPGVRLSVNASPTTVCTAALGDVLAAIPGERLAIEITEHAPVDDCTAVRTALARLRSCGVQLMVDDVGAGFASLKHIVDLNPDVIKLDLSLIRGIDTDPVRRALTAALLSFAGEIGASIVAEGIETDGELEALLVLGGAARAGLPAGPTRSRAGTPSRRGRGLSDPGGRCIDAHRSWTSNLSRAAGAPGCSHGGTAVYDR